METSFDTKKRNDGYATKRLREILGVKQEDLAEKLGLSQQAISKIEQSAILKDEQLEKIAKALNISVDAIKNFSEDAALNIISNSFTSNDNSTLNAINHQCTFNLVDKVVQLYEDKIALYERMLKAEQEKVSLLEEVLKNQK